MQIQRVLARVRRALDAIRTPLGFYCVLCDLVLKQNKQLATHFTGFRHRAHFLVRAASVRAHGRGLCPAVVGSCELEAALMFIRLLDET